MHTSNININCREMHEMKVKINLWDLLYKALVHEKSWEKQLESFQALKTYNYRWAPIILLEQPLEMKGTIWDNIGEGINIPSDSCNMSITVHPISN